MSARSGRRSDRGRLWRLARATTGFAGVLVICSALAGAGAQEAPARDTSPPPQTMRVDNQPPPSKTIATSQSESTSEFGKVHVLSGDPPYLTYKTPYEFHLTLITAALGVFMMLSLMVMAWRTGITEGFVRSFMVVTIVFGALFLVVAGYSDEQTAPVFGLLGTIVGYIFGRVQAGSAPMPDGPEDEDAKSDATAAGGAGPSDAAASKPA